MKTAREIVFAGVSTPDEAVRLLLRIRFAECLEKQNALKGDDDDAIHAFRLACKRLRYAIERFENSGTSADLKPVAKLLSSITDELGSAHDCVVLAKRAAECNADLVARRALADRDRSQKRASRLWYGAFKGRAGFEPLAAFTGFHWNGELAEKRAYAHTP